MKTEYVKIRLNTHEKELLKELAEKLNMTMSDYVKYCCLIKPLSKLDTPKK
jgi:antitoxin component of RelBE/YafQ-DinJ toxin-antitoxin module